MKLYKVFTAGKHGKKTEITEADIHEIADNYDPEYFEAPLTIDHKSDGGALGWVSNVIAKGKDLYVEFKDISEVVKNLTSKGEYKRPSIEIAEYEDKGKYLRAVSLVIFPAVKRLPAMQFSSDGEAKIFYSSENLEFSKNKKQNNNNMEITKFSEKLGLDEAATLEDIVVAFNEKYDDKVKEVADLTKKVETLETDAKKFAETQIDSLISSALASGKIIKSQEASIKTFAEANFDECRKYIDSLPVKSIYKDDQSKQNYKNNKSGEKELKYEDVLKDPNLAKKFSEEELEDLRAEYLK